MKKITEEKLDRAPMPPTEPRMSDVQRVALNGVCQMLGLSYKGLAGIVSGEYPLKQSDLNYAQAMALIKTANSIIGYRKISRNLWNGGDWIINHP